MQNPNERKLSDIAGTKSQPPQQRQYRQEEDFLFGQISASQLQEFKVLKLH
jgi:hypothetical protein